MEGYVLLTRGPAINEVPESAMAAQPSTQIPTMTYIYLSEKQTAATMCISCCWNSK